MATDWIWLGADVEGLYRKLICRVFGLFFVVVNDRTSSDAKAASENGGFESGRALHCIGSRRSGMLKVYGANSANARTFIVVEVRIVCGDLFVG